MDNRTSRYDFTVIVPVYNEQENLPELEKALSGFLPECIMKTCVLFVDDGSTDASLEGIKNVCSRNKDFFYISFEKNSGLSAALKAGIDHTESKYLGYMDADLQTTPEDFNLLLAEIEGCSMVIGIRSDRKDSYSKRMQSRIANSFRRFMTGDGAVDTGCPLKVLRTDAATLDSRRQSFIADSSPGRRVLQTGSRQAFPTKGWKVQISSGKPSLGPFCGLLCLPLDEVEIHQIQSCRGQHQVLDNGP